MYRGRLFRQFFYSIDYMCYVKGMLTLLSRGCVVQMHVYDLFTMTLFAKYEVMILYLR